eukprot:GHVR01058080.1.p2 GENE.GHVR01058080.1~~GHVR01058080.1.p2  ORF type:complete len:100 (+),score=7.79 GHVR01058080.1:140-439(+)
MEGLTPFMLAAYNGRIKVMEWLHKKGADLENTDMAGNTALSGTCTTGYLDSVNWLLQKGARVNVVNGLGHTPLFIATIYGHTAVVTALRKAGGVLYCGV